jgi:hypothetical protein
LLFLLFFPIIFSMFDPEKEETAPFASEILLHQLENLASQLNIEVRYESLADDELSILSGGCKALGRDLIIIDDLRSPNEQAHILARELSRYDLEDLYLLPRVREFIALHAFPGGKKRPQT